jgi:hypothetical protein
MEVGLAKHLAGARAFFIRHKFLSENIMFTILAFGLCAFVIETPQDRVGARLVAEEYPVVGIGIVYRERCRLTLVIAAGKQTLGIPINGHIRRFRVEKIDQASAVVWIDDEQSFVVPRQDAF